MYIVSTWDIEPWHGGTNRFSHAVSNGGHHRVALIWPGVSWTYPDRSCRWLTIRCRCSIREGSKMLSTSPVMMDRFDWPVLVSMIMGSVIICSGANIRMREIRRSMCWWSSQVGHWTWISLDTLFAHDHQAVAAGHNKTCEVVCNSTILFGNEAQHAVRNLLSLV